MAMTLGQRIKDARERLRWSQRQLADAVKVDRKTIDNWEHDRTRPRSSMGALRHVLQDPLDDGEPELPAIVRDHQDDPQVMELWGLTRFSVKARVNMITYHLEQAEAARRASGSALTAS